MHLNRSGLWLLLVLVSVVTTATWATALAGGATDPPTVATTCLGVSKPVAAPTTGEPDVGQTPRSTKPTGAMLHGPPVWSGWDPGNPAASWFRWIVRFWMMRYLGPR
jgi:hypothetical protein